MKKLDLRKDYKELYAAPAKRVVEVKVPRLKFIMLDGEIEPGGTPSTSESFAEAMMAMYGVAYTLKFTSKLRERNPIDYPVMAMEGLWWVKSGRFSFESKEPWSYTLMMVQPAHITPAMFRRAVEQVRAKRGGSPVLARLRLEWFSEGRCIQIMHVGPYADEPRTLALMDEYMHKHGLRFRGKHHEIYMGDPRRVKPERLKTLLRHAVERDS
ncbi:MAG: GyrI-like domain-containing protein [Chloroflexi bacterium]|nr:GyrI-like domain-containing protein [Chloroflexota bacterium]